MPSSKFAFIIGVTLAVIAVIPVSCRPAEEREYPLKLQPELDSLDFESYIKNPRNLDFQVKCLLYNGPCDVVGKWAKPRAKAAILGECLKCTEKQAKVVETWMAVLQKDRPDLYRASVAKFILNSGVDIPEEELTKVKETLEKLDDKEKKM